MNKIILIGNIGRDPEMSYTQGGTAVTKFSLAVTKWGKKEEGVSDTDWFNIVAWNKLAETCNQYLRKGQKVCVEGRVSIRKYTDRENVQRTSIEVIINEMEMLSPKSQQQDSNPGFDELGELEDHPF